MSRIKLLLSTVLAGVMSGLAGCGGGGGSDGGGGGIAPAGWVAGVFNPASSYVAQCAAPRGGTNPNTGGPFPDVQGSVLTENNWLRSWSNDLYLWYSEIVDRDPAPYANLAYFDLLKTSGMTPSGRPKDRFHFHLATSDWEQLAQSGVAPGYGATWAVVAATPPRQIVVAYTEPGSPAVAPAANLVRGAVVLQVDGFNAVDDGSRAAVDALNAGLFPDQAGESHMFTVQDPGSATTRVVTMTSVNVLSMPVPTVKTIATPSGTVGYMLFNDHLAMAEEALMLAVDQLKAAGVSDLVLDIRYNSGGYLEIASELAYMIAGSAQTAGKTFELATFNSKHPTIDPVNRTRIVPEPFQSTTDGFSVPAGKRLPTLDLPRVFVLTGPDTCSASESIINALEGIDVRVIQIGSTTCGKPYGFYPQDNCGTTYFTVEFKGVNAKGFGDYTDGFSPANTVNNPGAVVTGCSVGDDFTRALGDPVEGRLAAALTYRQTTQCPAASGFAPPGTAALSFEEPLDGIVYKPEWLRNRIMRR